MSEGTLHGVYNEYQSVYRQQQVVLSFEQFLELVEANPAQHMRNAPHYLYDTFRYYKTRESEHPDLMQACRFQLFDRVTEKNGPIIGGEPVHQELFRLLEGVVRSGYPSKLLLLHGPNGSSKTSTVEAISHAMQAYSKTDEGAVYRFNWVFPAERDATPASRGEGATIGFTAEKTKAPSASFALLEEKKISCRISSEFKENPLFLLPMPYRQALLTSWLEKKNDPSTQSLPIHILGSGLSKRNQQIFERLLYAYEGDLQKVFRHVQVERFFYSRQYRVGISTVEPQLSIDAYEKQLTLDKNYTNIPSVLHTISFHQSEGNLVEANRGLLEFSDFLKRPVEAFKYLLTSIEKGTITLASGTANLDAVLIATTNDKHLDAFKAIPDFSSFKGRIELITVPYLLLPAEEAKIYNQDIENLQKGKKIAPHCLDVLCRWACLTRLKQPNPELYAPEYRSLLDRLDPLSKLKLYGGESLYPRFTKKEEQTLLEIRLDLWRESLHMVSYEGRFGASPREVRALLHRAAQQSPLPFVTPEFIFDEIRKMAKDRSVYEFLQFEPRGGYHDVVAFIDTVQEAYFKVFEHEVIQAMSMADENEYDSYFARYVTHVVAEIKKEKIWEEATSSSQPPSQSLMEQVEKILGVSLASEHRASILSRIASQKLEHPDKEILLPKIFSDHIEKIKEHFYEEKRKLIEDNMQDMLAYRQHKQNALTRDQEELVEKIFANLETYFGYPEEMAHHCLQFLLKNKKR
jgi:serine protein kinase